VFAVAGRCEQLVDELLVGVGRRVATKASTISGSGRKADEIERQAPGKRALVRFGRGRESGRLELREDEGVDRIADPLCVLHDRQGGTLGLDERPMGLPRRALGDPLADRFLLGGLEDLPRLRRRHEVLGILGDDAEVERTLLGWLRTTVGPPSRWPKKPSSRSNRSFALRLPGSGPWHWKHASARMGRMSRLNCSFSSGSAADGAGPRRGRSEEERAEENSAHVGSCLRMDYVVRPSYNI
jgi:hypothetical protein